VGASVVEASVVEAAPVGSTVIVVVGSAVVVLETADGLWLFLEHPEIDRAMITATNLITILYKLKPKLQATIFLFLYSTENYIPETVLLTVRRDEQRLNSVFNHDL